MLYMTVIWRIKLYEYIVCRDEYIVCRDEYIVCRDEYIVCRDEYLHTTFTSLSSSVQLLASTR